MPKGVCPECDGDVDVKANANLSDLLECESCGTELELVGLDPVELDYSEDSFASEDFDDEDDDEY